jgi:hypothetical protein
MRTQSSASTVRLGLSVYWKLAKYVKSLGVSPSLDMWNHILCLTGSSNDLQSVTVATYLRQTWPTTGERLEGMLLEFLNCQDGQACSCMFPNNLYTSRTYKILDVLSPTLRVGLDVLSVNTCFIKIHGDPYTMPEFMEQIAWLAATLSLTPPPETLVIVSPRIHISSVEASTNQDSNEIWVSGHLNLDIQDDKKQFSLVKGTCWTKLFTNPVIVSGYPILRKSTPAAGLEASLGIMTSLLQAQ